MPGAFEPDLEYITNENAEILLFDVSIPWNWKTKGALLRCIATMFKAQGFWKALQNKICNLGPLVHPFSLSYHLSD
jgi:hypothetical protein